MSDKLKALTSVLLNARLTKTENVESWVDRCTLIPQVRNQGEYSEICQQHSSCTIFLERYSGDARLVMALVTAWLQDHDDNREQFELSDPEIDVTPLDSKKVDVEISVEFYDPVMVKPDPEGLLFWQDERWSLIDTPLIDIAAEVTEVEPQEKASE